MELKVCIILAVTLFAAVQANGGKKNDDGGKGGSLGGGAEGSGDNGQAGLGFGDFGGLGALGFGAGLGGGAGIGLGFGGNGGNGGGVVPAAILSNHIVNTFDVPSQGAIQPISIDVPANILPVNFVFRSASSLINVAHQHEGAKGSFKETSSQDEPHQLVHTVRKPIIQEVKEIISPYRKIVQEVEPVKEEIKTLVARGVSHGKEQYYGLKGHAAIDTPAMFKVNHDSVALPAMGSFKKY